MKIFPLAFLFLETLCWSRLSAGVAVGATLGAANDKLKRDDVLLPELQERQYISDTPIASGTALIVSSNPPAASSRPYSDDGPPSAAAEGGTGRRTVATTATQRRNFETAHGTIMGIAFVLVFPIGGLLVRLVKPPMAAWVHGGVQLLGYALSVTGLGLGIWLGLNVRYLDYAHTVIGMVVFSLLACQIGLGVLHHQLYRHRMVKTFWTHLHVWLGRVLIALGIINGGLGLRLAKNTRAGEIAYGTVAGVVGVVYISVTAFVTFRGARVTKAG